MSTGDRRRNNIRAGLFIAVSATLGLATFLVLQKMQWGPRTQYRLLFDIANGVRGLAVGSEVRIGGLPRGRVVGIEPIEEDGRLTQVEVVFELDRSVTLFRNAEAIRLAPLLGETAWINFATVGAPDPSAPDGNVLPPGGRLEAMESPGLLANIVGISSANRLVSIIERTEEFSTVLERIPGDYEDHVLPALDSASKTIVQLRSDYDRWRGRIDETLDAAVAAANNLEDGTRRAGVVVSDVQATLDENRPKLSRTLDRLETAADDAATILSDVRTDTMPQIARTLGEGERAISAFADLLDRADAELATRLPDIRTFLSDLRVAAGQLKLATIEVRRSPWRLLYRPSTEILAREQLFEAARSFASATGDLRSAAESVEELLRVRPDLLQGDPGLRGRLESALIDALGRYEEAQRRLYGVLIEER